MEIDLRTINLCPMRDANWVAAATGLSKKQVYALAADGTIPAFKPTNSRCVRFREDEILSYIESTRIQPPPKQTLNSVQTGTNVLDRPDDFKIEAVRRCG